MGRAALSTSMTTVLARVEMYKPVGNGTARGRERSWLDLMFSPRASDEEFPVGGDGLAVVNWRPGSPAGRDDLEFPGGQRGQDGRALGHG